jgi:hypothetical protein
VSLNDSNDIVIQNSFSTHEKMEEKSQSVKSRMIQQHRIDGKFKLNSTKITSIEYKFL